MNRSADGKFRLSLAARRRILVAAMATLVVTAAGTWAAARGQATAPAPHTGPVTAVDKEAAAAQYRKAKDLYDQGRYAEAQTENDKALALDPTSIDAALMRRVLQDRLAPAPMAATDDARIHATPSASASQPKLPTLSPWQISMVRLGEMSDKETPRGKFDRKSLEDFWRDVLMSDPQIQDKSAQAMNNFMNANNFQNQLRLIRQSPNSQRYLANITITNDPASITAFKNAVQPFVLQNCATSECHGGDHAGKFRLINANGGTEQLYTNFYLMSMYENKDGSMIDRNAPDRSLVIQYVLPANEAVVKHPKVDLKRIPASDPRIRAIRDFIKSLPFRPDYGFTFDLSGDKQAAK